jgi:hypothetical protein
MMKADVDLPVILKPSKRLFASRTAVYICIILVVALAASLFKLRTHTIFACPATLYSSDRYIAYCDAKGYADYEHGAFALGLEPQALQSARNAEVMFLGNSHLQVAFSTAAAADWFSAVSVRYYLMGFTYYENMVFAKVLLHKIRPTARVYVINVDDFFRQWETPPAKEALDSPDARTLYEEKRLWQRVHELVCKPAPMLCGHDLVYYRSRETGAYTKLTDRLNIVPVSYDQTIDQDVVRTDTANAVGFLAQLPVKRDCVILTLTPTAGTKIGDVEAVAKALSMDLVSPELPGLKTFDGSHLDGPSAQRWSQAFFQAAGPKILSCLNE